MKTSEAGLALIREEESLRLHAYPDPASDLARATRGHRWGFAPASSIFPAVPVALRGLSGAPWTIGYGTTVYPNDEKVKPDDDCTKAEASAWLELRVEFVYEAAVRDELRVPVTQGMFDALVSWTYNVGVGAMRTSTLMRKLNAGDYVGAAFEFDKWVKAGGQTMTGLVKRRDREQALFNAGIREVLAGQPDVLAMFEGFVAEMAA